MTTALKNMLNGIAPPPDGANGAPVDYLRGAAYDDLRWKRDMQRATVTDIANSCEQAGIQIEAAE